MWSWLIGGRCDAVVVVDGQDVQDVFPAVDPAGRVRAVLVLENAGLIWPHFGGKCRRVGGGQVSCRSLTEGRYRSTVSATQFALARPEGLAGLATRRPLGSPVAVEQWVEIQKWLIGSARPATVAHA